MSTVLVTNRTAMVSIGYLVPVSPHSPLEKEGAGKAEEMIWQLQDEVRVLQEALARTRRAVEQREVLLRNSQQREIELRAQVGAGKR